MILDNIHNYNILKTLRSHGWSRDTYFHKKFKKKYKNLNDKFLFINSGYNLRPTEIQAAIALNQFKRLNIFKKIRQENRDKIIYNLKSSKIWNNQFDFVKISKFMKPSWFGLAILINKKYLNKKNKFINFLNKIGIENRPILSGNFLNQPAAKLYNLDNKKKFPKADEIEKRGFFIGLHTKKMSNKEIKFLCNNLLKIEKI